MNSRPVTQPLTDPSLLEGYLRDASNLKGEAEGIFYPRTAADVQDIVREAQTQGVPLTVTAQRSSTTGAPVPEGGWLLSTEHMSACLEIGAGFASAQGGILLGELQDQIEEGGQLYPPDPTSRRECSLGGSIACNASGARSFWYGPTRDWVEELEVVLPRGERMRVTREDPIPADWPVPRWQEPAVKTAAGYAPADNLLDLFIGQEGTLGIITEARLRLTERPPGVLSMLMFFQDPRDGLAFVGEVRSQALRARQGEEAALWPRLIEWYDEHSLSMIRERHPEVPASARAAVWCEQPCSEEEEETLLWAWMEAMERHGALAEETLLASAAPELEKLYALRHALPAGVNELIRARGMPKVGTDCSVPFEQLPEMMALYESVPFPTVLFGHVGDAHLHLNIFPSTEAELEQAKALYRDICRRAVELGGSVSAEHGIGKLKRAHLAEMVGPETLQAFRALKTYLDPRCLLGRGTLFHPPEV